ncbi:Rho termination factor N-terminal domain-containing protein [Martelella lutilitoris]|mgnify:CR=1 FL=1|uniref:Rho termination factor N-terminal domain-containing protein n=1 Tax=Martelella lutilitoris TaxID=2583532 RepID=A0A7T7KML7_9HYPH|nr:Rho termination factor N-terminal domain-containing protein [Martelella lutilitoris]MAM10146.1 Rho termination factor [Rhizobiaceae bacterium]QQM31638.1 Rho termination factor N-terminal domain-containing protein [Martelella lutilitoris]|tara:strand:- start:296 stop:568 length:273 start_codon:yes stop_codon:yes gene_type:complete
MPKATRDQRPSVKDEETYQALRDDGASKEKAARIANAQANSSMKPSKKGGEADPYEEWTRDDLYDQAQKIGIEGRSKMDKGELIEALRNH